MKDRKSEIINKDIPLMNFNSILTTEFAKITPSLDRALNKCEEEFEEMLEELNVKEDDTVEDVHDISKRVIFEALDTFQAYATLVTYIASQRRDFDEIMEQWKRKQRQRIREYLGLGKEDCGNLIGKELLPTCGILGCIFKEVKNKS